MIEFDLSVVVLVSSIRKKIKKKMLHEDRFDGGIFGGAATPTRERGAAARSRTRTTSTSANVVTRGAAGPDGVLLQEQGSWDISCNNNKSRGELKL